MCCCLYAVKLYIHINTNIYISLYSIQCSSDLKFNSPELVSTVGNSCFSIEKPTTTINIMKTSCT